MTDQPETLRVAQAPVSEPVPEAELMARLLERGGFTVAAGMMREQHAEIERLREQLRLANIDALNESAENAALRAEVLEEREACAKVCENDGLLWGQRYAAAIRARGER